MHWNAFGNASRAFSVLPALLIGCRADIERGEPAQTIVVHDASRAAAEPREFDSGDRAPNRIEVVVADPRSSSTGASPLSALVGRNVRVQFRRDALGTAAPAPIPPMGQGPGGRAVSLTGTVRSATGGWLVLERDRNTYYVAMTSILVIEAPDVATTSPAVE